LPSPSADSIAHARSSNGAAHANSRMVWQRSAARWNCASGASVSSIATAVWVALCASIPMMIF
jgi:hypothetical protein